MLPCCLQVVHVLDDSHRDRMRWEQQLAQHFVRPLQQAIRDGDMPRSYGISVSYVMVLVGFLPVITAFLSVYYHTSQQLQLAQHFVGPLQQAIRRNYMPRQYSFSAS
jgi:hypothetical protein